MASRRKAVQDPSRIHLTRTDRHGSTVDEKYVDSEAQAVGLEFNGYVRDQTPAAAPAEDPS